MTDVDGIPVGLSICYDLRFPELYRALALAGAQVLTVPANFTERTGRDHWEVLLRARAIENGAYVLAPSQIDGPPGQPAFGRSMVIDPWGTIVAQAADTVAIVRAELDLDRVAAVRRQIPVLANRRPDTYPALNRRTRPLAGVGSLRSIDWSRPDGRRCDPGLAPGAGRGQDDGREADDAEDDQDERQGAVRVHSCRSTTACRSAGASAPRSGPSTSPSTGCLGRSSVSSRRLDSRPRSDGSLEALARTARCDGSCEASCRSARP